MVRCPLHALSVTSLPSNGPPELLSCGEASNCDQLSATRSVNTLFQITTLPNPDLSWSQILKW